MTVARVVRARSREGRRARGGCGALAVALAIALVLGGGAPLHAAVPQAPPGEPDTRPHAEPGSELRVWLITIGPGEAIWERFGHNALRVVDTRTGYDASYNWGIFDFQQEGFITRFLQGRMLYMMAAFASGPMIEQYRAAGREVLAQELALTPSQKLELHAFAERNARPENREYFYHYFLDNCSTRVRDLLDLVLGGALAERFENEPTGTSYRDHTRRLTQADPALFTGMDVLLGAPGDQPITRWQEMFIPMSLRDAVREMEVSGDDGVRRPLVASEELIAPARVATEPEAPPGWLPVYLLLGLGGAAVFVGLGRGAARSPRVLVVFGALVGVWGAITGLAGVTLVLVLFTDHDFMTWNENLFLLSPVALALAVAGPWAVLRGRGGAPLERAAGAVALLGVIGLLVGALPFARQDNALQLALLLPPHAGLWVAARHLARPREPG